ncbi:polyribonucleotide nucleotidyltransferase [candidate division KSB1 bacterium]|nr:polyribonucleotide nucleotidyltransferase [candidate division KSB1 bacterium]
MIIRKELVVGGRKLIFETGKLAKQADGACWVQFEDTVIHATAVASKKPLEKIDFFPLSVEYRQMAYAAGKIPGGFFKREGKPSEKEVLSARLIDRPLRPLFPEGYRNEVQVIVNVLSSDKKNDADVLGVIGASTALSIATIPFDGPIGAVRVGRINGEFLINPTFEQVKESEIELIIAASEHSIIMVEGEAREISESDMLAALALGFESIQPIIQIQKELMAECGKTKAAFEVVAPTPELKQAVLDQTQSEIETILAITDKKTRGEALATMVEKITTALIETYPDTEAMISAIIDTEFQARLRQMIIATNRRVDGRNIQEIRPIACETGLLPRTHGSALFTRGQTQALAVTTLGSKMDEQKMDELEGEFYKSYMLHYNFPPFSVGEVKPLRGPSRRDIGHGNLAERALKATMPADGVFPYTVRVVSEIMESNGSSSMATVCAGSLALMDAGVPVKSAVAGIAMGLIKEGDEVRVLSDILGDEDHYGDMDFKVAGTRSGITAFQMDIKIAGISMEIMRDALEQARQGRLYILDIMEKTLSAPRAALSQYAPRIISFKVNTESIGTIIGPGGKMIREIIERSGASIDIADDGTVTIASFEAEGAEKAQEIIASLVAEPEVGKVYDGKVKRLMPFGAFVEILPGKEGLLHISEIAHQRVNRVEDVLKVGQEIKVKLMRVDGQGKLDLSHKVLINRETGEISGS